MRNLYIESNANLTSLAGLNNITTIAGGLWIHHFNTLTSLDGLANLVSVGGTIHIYSNNNLAALDLDNLDSVGDDFWILGNPDLPRNLVTTLRDQVLAGGGIGGEITICGNQGGTACN